MNLHLIREPSSQAATIGRLEDDSGRWMAWTLEDVVRERAGVPVSAWKMPGSTAIPSGTYQLQLTYSPKFKTVLPILVDVPGYTGVRIHAGNSAEDTEGCILVGLDRGRNWIGRSREALGIVLYQLQGAIAASELVYLTVENAPGVHLAESGATDAA